MCFVFFKQKTAYEMRISDWSSDVCSSDLRGTGGEGRCRRAQALPEVAQLDAGAQHGHRDEERQEAKTHTISPIAAILLQPAAQRIACRVRISSLSAPESFRLENGRALWRRGVGTSGDIVVGEP